MPTLLTVTLSQLRTYTAAQIATALKNKIDTLTKRQLIHLVLTIQASYDTDTDNTVADDAVVTVGPDGQVASQVQVIRDVLGAKKGSRRIEWTYRAPEAGRTQGPVDTITVSELDAAGNVVSQQVIRHG